MIILFFDFIFALGMQVQITRDLPKFVAKGSGCFYDLKIQSYLPTCKVEKKYNNLHPYPHVGLELNLVFQARRAA